MVNIISRRRWESIKKAIVLGLVTLLVIGSVVVTSGRAQAQEQKQPPVPEHVQRPEQPPMLEESPIPDATVPKEEPQREEPEISPGR